MSYITSPSFKEDYKKALEKARSFEKGSPEWTSAWTELEDMQNAYENLNPEQSFDAYCESNPSALECRMYDV